MYKGDTHVQIHMNSYEKILSIVLGKVEGLLLLSFFFWR